ncbi:MAG: cysteine synthase A [Blautia sp.]|jgi:cysteine synthase A
MRIYKGVETLIGNTPLMELVRLESAYQLEGKILAKLEYLNPAGSIKDRTAYGLIDGACKKGLLKKGAVLIEPTSGNTGIGLAMLASVRGYRLILTMPDTMSKERINILKAYGAEVVLTDGSKGMAGAVEKANELAEKIPGSYIPGQFDNPLNPAVHQYTTGPEIWEDTDGQVDVLVAGVGTGGTITGVGEYLKSKNPEIKIVAVEPSESPVISGGKPGSHGIQGIGGGFVPKVFCRDICDGVFTVSTNKAIAMSKELVKKEGILTGISSGAALYAAIRLAQNKYAGKNIVVILPDSGDRYYSTPLFEN